MVERLSRFLDSHTWGKMGKGVQLQSNIPVSQAQLHGVDGPGQQQRMSLENEDQALNAAIEASLQGMSLENEDQALNAAIEAFLQNEDQALNGAIEASLQEQALNAAIEASLQDSALPPIGCLDEDGSRGRSDSTNHSHYTDSLRVAQEMEFEAAMAEDKKRDLVRQQEDEKEAMAQALKASEEEAARRVLADKSLTDLW
ncbi:hypothetical protein T484DRAFT_1791077 [Baffinella frigidus]|nr:hypothetical protein T484DRAFT_1791077 [Cryptophyta sp. CCMP2293]